MPHLLNLDTMKVMDPAELFGKDSKRLLAACDATFKNWLRPFDCCYRSPSRPYLNAIRKDCTGDVAKTYKAAIAEWEESHPEEAAKERLSRKDWEAQRDKQFRIIYGIARRHGLYLEWHGPSCGDQWTVYRHGKPLARICCL